MKARVALLCLLAAAAHAEEADGGLDAAGAPQVGEDAGTLAVATTPYAGSGSPVIAPSTDATAAPTFRWESGAGVGLRVAEIDLRLSSFLQVDFVPFSQASVDALEPSTGQPLNEVALSLQHLRVGLWASRWIFSVSGAVDVSTAGGIGVRLYSAELAVRWPTEGLPLVQLRAGLLRIPFGADLQLETLERAFLEPTTASRALFPGAFDLGLVLSGGWRFVRYQLAVMNGEPVGERALPLLDRNAAKDFVGRLGVDGAPTARVRLQAGLSGLWGTGFHPGSPATKDTITWRDANEDGLVQTTELQVVGGLPATASSNFDRFALGGDLQLSLDVPHLGLTALFAELVWSKNLDRGLYLADPVFAGRPLRELGWSVALTQQLPLGFALGVRHDAYDPDADAAAQLGAQRVPFDASVATWSFMASWRWQRTARLVAQFDHQTNALGRGLSGAPASLGSDRLTFRAEVAL